MSGLEFGDYLKGLRKSSGLTLAELGEKVGLSHSYLSQIETGKKGIPSPEIIKKLSEALGEDYGDLMVKAGHMNVDSQNNKSMSYAASVIADTILNICESAKEKSAHIEPIVNSIEYFKDQLIAVRSGAKVSISFLRSILWEIEADGDSMKPLIGSYSETRQIEGLLKALEEVRANGAELLVRRGFDDIMMEMNFYIYQPDITYNGHPLTDQDRQRILDMLKALFPEYSAKGE